MKNFSTWMLVFFMIMFWGFRIFIAIGGELNIELNGLEPFNQEMEVALLFITLLAIILVIKRKILGGLIYLLTYGMYFGTNLMENIQTLVNALEGKQEIYTVISLIVSIIGIILPVSVMMDLIMDKGRKINPKDKKTDWFYKNKDFDRKMDDRADKNNYRTM